MPIKNLLKDLARLDVELRDTARIYTAKAESVRDIIKDIPLNLLLIETDSPFLTPIPHRGKTNEPSYVYYVGKYLSEYLGISIEEFEKITDNNYYTLFNKAIRYKEILYEN